jgi:PDZ domain
MDSRNLLCGHCGPRIATLSCERCGMPLCSECLVEGRCPACARDLLLRRRRRRGLVLALLAGLVPGVLMTSVAGVVLKRATNHHRCQRSILALKREVRLMQHGLLEARSVRPKDDPVPIKVDQRPRLASLQIPQADPIVKAGPGRYVVDRLSAVRILNNPMSQGRVVPVQRDGRLLGIKLYRIRPESSYYRLGLRNGDIIRRINGTTIGTPRQAISLYNRMRKANRITLQVLRQGKLQTLRYWITEA